MASLCRDRLTEQQVNGSAANGPNGWGAASTLDRGNAYIHPTELIGRLNRRHGLECE